MWGNQFKKVDLTGSFFGKWKVLGFHSNAGRGRMKWICQCECGTIKNVASDSLKSGQSNNCGCVRRSVTAKRSKTHGLTNSSEYRTWSSIKARCTNPKANHYKHYGGRGIKVSDEWLFSFETFLKDMGPKPSKNHTIERDDVNGDYCASNCRWLLKELQAKNKRNSRILTYDGISLNACDWARKLNIKLNTFSFHAKKERGVEEIISITGVKYYPNSIKVNHSFGVIN